MKKLFLVTMIIFVAFSSLLQAGSARLVHEWTVDLYYANGVLATEEETAKLDWRIKTKQLKAKYPSLKQALRSPRSHVARGNAYVNYKLYDNMTYLCTPSIS